MWYSFTTEWELEAQNIYINKALEIYITLPR